MSAYKGIFGIAGVHSGALRTREVVGSFERLPSIGDSFAIYGKPLNEDADVRMVNTSLIKEIVSDETSEFGIRRIVFKTLNSTYYVEYDTKF